MGSMEKQVMNFDVIIEQDEDSIYLARVPEIDGCYTQGRTLQEVLERIKEAIEVCLEADGESISHTRFVGLQRVQVEKPQIT